MNSTAIHRARVRQGARPAACRRPRLRCLREIPLALDAVELVDDVRNERPRAFDRDGAGSCWKPGPYLAAAGSVVEPGRVRRVRTGAGCACRCGSCRSMSFTSRSAMSWVKPSFTTTRSAARSVRFAGNV